MKTKCLSGVIIVITLCCIICANGFQQAFAQVTGPQQIRWICVGELHNWFSNGCAEIEYGRRGRANFLNTDQIDGLIWPGEYTLNKGINVGEAMWIGATNFSDPIADKTFPYRVVCAGERNMYLNSEIFPMEFSLVGKFIHPAVNVNNEPDSYLESYDALDRIDPAIPCDRMITNTVNTPIGITVKRRILAFTQQYHDNYLVYEYTFINTGIIDNIGTSINPPRTLTSVVFHFQYRFAFPGESYLGGWSPTTSSWGRNTINDCYDGKHPGPFRACWEYYGPISSAPSLADDIGLPNYSDGSILAGTNFAGVVVLHADKSSTDRSDDPSQPSTTQFMGSDGDAQTSGISNTLYCVSFSDANNGTAVGASGTILRTSNGGTDWITQISGISNDLRSVSFTDVNNGTAVGASGTILRTTNGGTNWTAQTSGISNTLYGASFTDANNGTAVGASGKILHTTNGGTDWITQTSGISSILYGVSFTDANNGTAVGAGGKILHTTTGGTNWTAQTSGTTSTLYSVSFADANNGTAVGTSGTILRTANGGTNWTTQTSGTTNALNSVTFTDANNGTAVGLSGTILRTTDGGINWTVQTSGTTNTLNSVTSTDANNGTAVGGGTILHTTNGGTNWSAQTLDNMFETLYSIMTEGQPTNTHAEEIGKDSHGWPTGFANTWGVDAGGYSSAQGFGPYTLAPGDSVKIVVAQSVAGIIKDRGFVRTIAKNWFNNSSPFVLPDGSTTTDRDMYKNAWVFTGKDSLFQTFRRAIANFNNNYAIPQPPPPPGTFTVKSGSDRIILQWSSDAESWPNFNGYRIYRAVGGRDSTYARIFECDKNNIIHSFDDTTALRGNNYYYYMQTKDDGSTNNIEPGVPLVSSKFYTMMDTMPGRLTGVAENGVNIPKDFILNQNFPNPFNPTTTISFSLPKRSFVSLKIFDLLGREVTTIVSEEMTKGNYSRLWKAANISSGVYFYQLQAGSFIKTKKLILLQ